MADRLDEIRGLGKRKAEALREAGYREPRDLRKATRTALASVEGIGEELATQIKRQAGSSRADELRATVSASMATPEDWQLTDRQATYLAERSGIEARRLLGEVAADLADVIDWQLDPWFLGYQRVCGVVKRLNPETNQLEPVPHATVHVEDTDCSFLGYFPDEPPWGWLWPFNCRREVIATVRTNACGEFCVYVPRWEIDRILRFRREHYCLPELVKPTIEDILRDPRVLPEPPWPGPRPDPGPIQFDQPRALDRLREVVGDDLALELATAAEPTFGDRKHAGTALMERPAFVEPMAPPLPPDAPDRVAREGYLEAAPQLKTLRHHRPLTESGFIGPYLACHDIYVPEWVTVTDVPDVTFRVTQDVDGDGHEEPIYEEGFFDVRWDDQSIPDVTLIADGSAISVPTCDAPDIAEGECGELRLLTAGLMSLEEPYHDPDTGYARRPNLPKVPDGSGGFDRPDTETPYTGVLQLHGCVRVEDAEFYRVKYAYEGHEFKEFTDLEWHVPRLDPAAGSLLMSADGDGWYPIPPKDELVFPYWVLNWPTGRFPDGTYELVLEVANASKKLVKGGKSEPVALVVDNSRPRVDYRIEWSDDRSIWHRLAETCPVVYRQGTESIHFRVTYTASARHFRDVKVHGSGCGGGAMTPTSSSGYEHWYTDPETDNSHTATVEFEVPHTRPDGTYTIRFDAHGRAFNPSGGRGGPSKDWYYDAAYAHTHPGRHVAIVSGEPPE